MELAAAAIWLGARAAPIVRRSWEARVAVAGRSMAPTLLPGEWLLVHPEAYLRRAPRRGELVLVTDPRQPQRLLVKRVTSIEPGGWLRIGGDDPSASTDSRTFGSIEVSAVEGRPWFRYWPLRRAGRIR